MINSKLEKYGDKMKILLPQNVKTITDILKNSGYESFIVGGCVRDSLMGLTPHDWDICTSAKPEQIKKCFENFNTFDSGIKHGTISIVIDKEIYEVTTYRIDGEYSDNRHPKSVTFTDDITKDLARRDFNINAMAYNESVGLVDPFNGQTDLQSKTIKCVRNPDKRFNEDALRIIRALRFASTYGLSIEKNTSESIIRNAHLLNNIAVERISTEFNKLICGKGAEDILNKYREVIAVFIPEIRKMFDFKQKTKHHNRDVWHHTTHSVSQIDNDALLRITMLFHDLGKPDVCTYDADGSTHFKGHPKYSAQKAEVILRRLKYPTSFIEDCIKLIIYHDVRFNGTKRQLKHVMSAIGEDNVRLLLKVQRADMMAQSDYKHKEKLETLDNACKVFEEILVENSCFTLKQLKVNGNDLKNIGITEGKQIGKTLKYLLSLVIDEKVKNEKSALLNKAEKFKTELS